MGGTETAMEAVVAALVAVVLSNVEPILVGVRDREMEATRDSAMTINVIVLIKQQILIGILLCESVMFKCRFLNVWCCSMSVSAINLLIYLLTNAP